jgi:hypothetical protein
MPLHKLSRTIRREFLDVRRALETEWRTPTPSGDAGAGDPVIYECDPGPNGGAVEIYIVWDRWEHIPHNDRSEVILDAFEAVRGDADVHRVGVALGLTPSEAEQMRLPYDPAKEGSGERQAGST